MYINFSFYTRYQEKNFHFLGHISLVGIDKVMYVYTKASITIGILDSAIHTQANSG